MPSHFDLCPPLGALTVLPTGDAEPLIHCAIAWAEQTFRAPYSLTQYTARSQRTSEHVGGFTAWYGEGWLTPEIAYCPGYDGGSRLNDRPSSAHPDLRWKLWAQDPTGQWVAVPVEELRQSMRNGEP